MKTTQKLYLVAMRSTVTNKPMTWISTSDFDNDDGVAVLDEFELEYEVKQSEEEIEAIVGTAQQREIARLKEKLAALEK